MAQARAPHNTTDLRLRLLANGYEPVPVIGKAPTLTEWQKIPIDDAAIRSWTPRHGRSTGGRTKFTSCLDSDISEPEAAAEVDDLVRNWFDGRGILLTRFGRAPRRAFLFRTDIPFEKKVARYLPPGITAADVTDEKLLPKIEFLCNGQQVVLFGVHPDTKKPYSWHADRDPTIVPRNDLPAIDDAEADRLLADIYNLLLARGYQPYERSRPKSNGSAAAADGHTDYAAQLRDAVDGADVNAAQSRWILSQLNRAEHPDDVERIGLGKTLAAKAWNKQTWTKKKETACIRARIRSALRKLNGEVDHDSGEIPSWVHSDFHDAYCRIIIDGGWPELIRPGHRCRVVDVRPKPKDDGATPRAIPLTAEEWLRRELPPLDYLMGDWLTTTSRIMFSADTGIDKSSFWLAVLAYCAAGANFLHWRCHRPARVLFVDGEMSRRWLQKMISDATRRLGTVPATMFFISREDYPNMRPLNTPAGKAFILAYVELIGGVDIIALDNLMSLLVGELKEPASWQNVLELVAELSRRNIGQVWINHTGHDASKSYGDKTRDWRMTSTIYLTKIERLGTDVSFELKFGKARERTPLNRDDFQTVNIALVNDTWVCSAAIANQTPPQPGTVEAKCLDLLHEALNDEDGVTEHRGQRAIAIEVWRTRCERGGVCAASSEKAMQTIFNRARRKLASSNVIGCDEELGLVWVL